MRKLKEILDVIWKIILGIGSIIGAIFLFKFLRGGKGGVTKIITEKVTDVKTTNFESEGKPEELPDGEPLTDAEREEELKKIRKYLK